MSSPLTLLTGATGSIGSALARRLSANGQRVRVVVRSPGRAQALQALPGVEIFSGDLRQPESLRGCADGCSTVYHLAAKLSGTDRPAFDAINITGTQAVLDEAVRAGVGRFVHASTIAVYGLGSAQNIGEDADWPPCRLPYVVTKREADRRAQVTAQRIPVTIARLGDVIGPGQYTWTINFIQRINQGLLMPPRDAESGMLNPVYIDNLLDALLLLGTHPAAADQIFNVVDGAPIRISDYIRRLAQMAGKHPGSMPAFVMKAGATLLMLSDRLRGREATVTPFDIDYLLHKSTISNEKIRRVLGWMPAVNLEEAFQHIDQWLRQEGYLKE